MSVEIRYITPVDDRMEISNIYEQSWKTAYKGIVPQEYLDSIPQGRWASKVDTPEWNTMLCLVDGKIVGTSSFCGSRFNFYKGYGEIISIYFLPEYVGKGYGKKLMERVLSELKDKGFDKVFLWVLEENRSARCFYEKMGFEPGPQELADSICGKVMNELSYVLTFEE